MNSMNAFRSIPFSLGVAAPVADSDRAKKPAIRHGRKRPCYRCGLPEAILTFFVMLVGLPVLAGEASDEAAPFGFASPEVLVTDWSSRALQVADVDGDDRNDLAAINNDRARIEFFLQRKPGEKKKERTGWRKDRWEPELDNSRFEKLPLVTGVFMYDLALGDLNGDGRLDLAYTTEDEELVVRLHEAGKEKDDFSFGEEILSPVENMLRSVNSVTVADVDGDGDHEVWVRTREALLCLSLNDRGLLEEREQLAFAAPGSSNLRFADFDGDDRLDIAVTAAGAHALRVRHQRKDGGFGPEQILKMDKPNAGPVVLEGCGSDESDKPVLATLSEDGAVTFQRLEMRKDPKTLLPATISALRMVPGDSKDAPVAWGDLNHDGRTDMVSADPEGAEVYLFLQQADGALGKMERFPSFAEVNSLAVADLDGDKKAELIVCSSEEQKIGVSRFHQGRLDFPKVIPVDGRPVQVAVADVLPTQGVELLVAARDGTDRVLSVLSRGKDKKWSEDVRVELEDLRSDPVAIRVVDADQDGRMDVALFVPFKAMTLVLQTKHGEFEITKGAQSFGEGFMEKVSASAFGVVDVDGDDKPEMLVGKKGFIRAVRLGEEGEVEVVEQFNASSPAFDVKAFAFAELSDEDEGEELVMLDTKAERMEIHARTESGVYQRRETLEIPVASVSGFRKTDVDGNDAIDFLLLTERSVVRMELEPTPRVARRVGSFETDLKDVTHYAIASGDFNHDGRDDLVLLDNRGSRMLEILDGKGGEWNSAYNFIVFESDPHFRGRKGAEAEPRQVLAADVTNDEKDDLILLVHDRVLVYPQD